MARKQSTAPTEAQSVRSEALPDRQTLEGRIETERNKLLGVLGALRIAAVAAGHTGIERPTWDDMEIMLRGAAQTLDGVFCRLDTHELCAPAEAQEVARV